MMKTMKKNFEIEVTNRCSNPKTDNNDNIYNDSSDSIDIDININNNINNNNNNINNNT